MSDIKWERVDNIPMLNTVSDESIRDAGTKLEKGVSGEYVFYLHDHPDLHFLLCENMHDKETGKKIAKVGPDAPSLKILAQEFIEFKESMDN